MSLSTLENGDMFSELVVSLLIITPEQKEK
jgi:hypothetical protein